MGPDKVSITQYSDRIKGKTNRITGVVSVRRLSECHRASGI